jgi:hypothetical protein
LGDGDACCSEKVERLIAVFSTVLNLICVDCVETLPSLFLHSLYSLSGTKSQWTNCPSIL